jgi:Rha family phage regulatory protein
MTNIISFAQGQTMSSREIAELTGKEHYNVMRDIKSLQDQVGDRLKFEVVEYMDAKGESRPMYLLDKKQTLLLVSGYNALLRLKIIDRWEELERQSGAPRTLREALLLAAKLEEEREMALLQVDNLNTVLDNLLDWVSIIKVATFNGVRETRFNWRVLKSKSEELGFAIKKAESPRFGYQNLYHITVFKACYPQFNYNLK